MEDRSKRRARLILIVGFLLALLAAVGTFLVASGGQQAAPAAVPTTNVLVAARDIAPKTQIAAADLKVVKMNSDAVPAAAIGEERQVDVIGKVATFPITTGEFILDSKFAATGAATFTVFPQGIPSAPGPTTPNYRAMSITVADQFAAGGAVAVGDLVDILYTMRFDPSVFFATPTGGPVTQPTADGARITDWSSKIILERVPVIARALTVYTIRTDATTAEQLAYLQAAGAQIQLLLRAPTDDRVARTTGATFAPVYRTFLFPIPTRITP